MNAVERAATDRLSLSMEDYRHALERPLLLLPLGLRQPALAFWTCHKHLKGFETALPLSGMFSVWIDLFGLRVDDAIAILMRMLHPSKMAGFEFSGQIVTSLANDVNSAIERRRKEAENERIRREQEAMDAEAPKAERGALLKQFTERVAEIGVMPDRERPAPDHKRNAAFLEAVTETESARAAG